MIDDIKKMIDNGKEKPEELAIELAKLVENHTKGLENNKNTILLEKKELADKIKNLQDGLDKIDIKEYNELKNAKTKGELVEKGSSSDLADLQIELTKLQTNNQLLETRLTEVSESKTDIENRLKSDKITLALTNGYSSIGVKKEYIPMLVKANKDIAKTQINEDGNLNVLMTTDGGGLVDAKSFFESWKVTDIAKAFIGAPLNKGAGATGSGASGGKNKKDMTISEATRYVQDNGQEAFNNLQ